MAEVRKLTQADIDRILFQQSLGNRTPDQIIADNLAKGTGIQKLDPNFAQTAAAGARKVAQTVDKFGGVRNYLPFPIAGLLPPEVDAKVSDLMGISGTARFYDALGAGKAPNPLDVIDMAGVSATAAQGAKLGAKGVVAAGKAAAPVAGNMAEQYAVKTGLLNPMIAWHGSPYSFDKFDLGHVGKGEGAQAYGHGMYFAESPKVAGEYRTRLSPDVTVASKGVDSAYKFAAESFKESGAGFEEALKGLSQAYKNAKPADLEAAARSVFDLPYGTLYKVDIPDKAVGTFLDWDKPLSQQPKNVRAAIQKTKTMLPPNAKDDLGGDLSLLYGKDVTPNQFLNTWESLTGSTGSGEAALNKVGVQGIRYLDGGSRGTGAGTSNFVVFDPSIVKILERNGQPAGLLQAPKTQYELAHEAAQKNAVEMLGLPPNNTAMDRARALGYDQPVYRGTNADEVSHQGNVWVTDTPAAANYYAGHVVQDEVFQMLDRHKGGNVMPLVGNNNFIHADAAQPLWNGGSRWQVPAEALRSRFAAFDPKRINEPDILAAGVPLGLIAGSDIELPKPKERKKKK